MRLASLLARLRPPPAVQAARRARRLGRAGERAAARHLRRRGYRILGRNVRTPCGEIDLLALEGARLVLVEVKSSRRRRGAALAQRLGRRQRRRLQRAGRSLRRHRAFRGFSFRIDLVTVTFDGWRRRVSIRRDVAGA